MISGFPYSSLQFDREHNLEVIIWAEESLCSATSHCYSEHNHFFWVYWICWPPTPQQFSITLAPIPLHHLEYKCRSLSVPYLMGLCQVSVLFVCSSFQLATQVILWLLCSCQAAEGSCHKAQSASYCPLAFSLGLQFLSPLLTLDHWLYSLNLPSM